MTEALIADWAQWASVPMADDGVINYWLSDTLSSTMRDHFTFTYNRLDDVLPINFTLTSYEDAEIRNHQWGDMNTPSGNWAGYARTVWDSSQQDSIWTVHVKTFTSDFGRVLALHEVAHALGLEHPFDSGDGDVWDGNTTYDDTVMSYNQSGNTILDYRKADWDALTGLYGGTIPDIIEPEPEPVTPTPVPEPEPTPPVTPTPPAPQPVPPAPLPEPTFTDVTLSNKQLRRLTKSRHSRNVIRKLLRWGVVDNISPRDYNKMAVGNKQTFMLQVQAWDLYFDTLIPKASTGCTCCAHHYPHSHITN